jgi:hypothetical protein
MWISVDEIVALGRARRKVLVNIASGKWESREAGVGRNGKPVREVALASLPVDLQREYLRQQQPVEPESDVNGQTPEEDTPSSPDSQLAKLTQALSRYPQATREAYINEVNRLDRIVLRYDALNPKRTRDAHDNLDFTPEVKALCREAVCSEPLILAREPKRGKVPSPFSLDRWSRRRKAEGLITYLRATPTATTNKVDKRKAQISPDAAEWLNDNWRNSPSPKKLYEKLQKKARVSRWKIPSYSWLYLKYKAIFPVVRTAVFQTDKIYQSLHKPYVPRSVADLDALQMLCGDHHVLDVHCWIEETKQLVRLWLTAWQDMRTGLFWGYHLDVTPSSYTIGCAYANGVRSFYAQPCSRPDESFHSYLYTDNGKDYKSRNLKGEVEVHKQAARIEGGLQMLLTQQGVGLASDADVKQFFARNYNGREKPIERAFKDLADSIQHDFFRSGWCGRSTSDRPDSWRDLYARHVKAAKRGQTSPFPTDRDIRAWVADWIHKYNTSVHTRANLGGAKIVPLAEYQRLYTTRYEISDSTLALMLMKPTRGALKKDGVWCLGSHYWHEAMSEFKGQRAADGKFLQLEVRYTDEDYRQVWVLLPNGVLVEATRLAPSSVLTPNKETHAAVAQMIKHERGVINQFQLIQQSNMRGESVEDRVAQLIEVEQPMEEELPLAVNASDTQSRVQKIGRLDGKKLRAVQPRSKVTSEQVSSVAADVEIFETPEVGRVSEFDYED